MVFKFDQKFNEKNLTTKEFLGIIAITAITIASIMLSYDVQAQQIPPTNTNNTSTTIFPTQVLVGGGNNSHPLYVYAPQTIEIKAGTTVVWKVLDNAPMEPHTVSFILNNKTMTSPDVPFNVKNSTQFISLPPGANSEPNIIPGNGGMNTVIVSNARSYIPVVIDANNNVNKSSHPNGVFTIKGNEQYINSGWLLPKGGDKIFPGSSNTFTVTFQKAGTYGYLCELHPWMVGQIIVR